VRVERLQPECGRDGVVSADQEATLPSGIQSAAGRGSDRSPPRRMRPHRPPDVLADVYLHPRCSDRCRADTSTRPCLPIGEKTGVDSTFVCFVRRAAVAGRDVDDLDSTSGRCRRTPAVSLFS